FPATTDEMKKSPLKGSRVLTLYSAQCVAMTVADFRDPNFQKYGGASKPPVAVLDGADGSQISKVESNAGKLKLDQVEKVVDSEMKQRESALDGQLKEGKEKAKAGDKTAAIAALKPVVEEQCL